MTRAKTERAAQRWRKWVYEQNPGARNLVDKDVVKIKTKLGHFKGLKKKRK